VPLTYNELYIEMRRALKDAGVGAFSLEARLLLALAAEKTPEALLSSLGLYTSPDIMARARDFLARRVEGEPAAYILGEWEFYGLPLLVTPEVLIPRIDTEVLAQFAIDALRGREKARVMDLCCGSGCLGCAIANAIPSARVVMADNSPAALAIAKANMMKNHLNPRVSCIEADALSAPPMMIGSFELLVCNPPYIPTGELAALERSVRAYEPRAALDGGQDGLDFYRAILRHWLGAVKPGGLLAFEVGVGQAMEVMRLMETSGLREIGSESDSGGIVRVVHGQSR
jgi:release factor glutamine methyltransferase